MSILLSLHPRIETRNVEHIDQGKMLFEMVLFSTDRLPDAMRADLDTAVQGLFSDLDEPLGDTPENRRILWEGLERTIGRLKANEPVDVNDLNIALAFAALILDKIRTSW